jgi:hypothetical protein
MTTPPRLFEDTHPICSLRLMMRSKPVIKQQMAAGSALQEYSLRLV